MAAGSLLDAQQCMYHALVSEQPRVLLTTDASADAMKQGADVGIAEETLPVGERRSSQPPRNEQAGEGTWVYHTTHVVALKAARVLVLGSAEQAVTCHQEAHPPE